MNTKTYKKAKYEAPMIEEIHFGKEDIMTVSNEEWYTGQEENEGIII